MGFSDNTQETHEMGGDAAKADADGMSVEQQPFLRSFVRMCKDGFDQGWHEANGGNLTYRLTEEDVAACEGEFSFDRPWTPMGVQADNLRNAYFLTTGSGKFMRNVPLHPANCLAHRMGPREWRQANERVPYPLHESQRAFSGNQRCQPRDLPCALPQHHNVVHAYRT